MSQPDANPPADFTLSLPESWRAAVEQRGSPAERIEVIEDSLRCYAYGWLSCLPVIGVAWLYPAVRRFLQARRRKVQWNPARGYLAAGLALGSVGWVVALVSWLVVLNALAVAGDFVVSGDDLLNLLPHILFLGSVPSLAGLCVAWATVWGWLANLPARLRVGAAVVALVAYGTFGYLALSESFRYRFSEDERSFRAEITGLGLWLVWLLGGFVLLARREARLRSWLTWFVMLVVLSVLFAKL
ncbi:MAG: hypothetical protein FD161_3351 [Limisphaerales bacterium]|nr:MAG: hypothetical protein FD161_3351 [Limisphaerales bacterium]KAG0507866.1 MAG: hypothetical protein E1N63_3017 [Limisphaerales bacterium]TXT48674.1 MAG: hypothetical protein FD140_3609 [Limisphaerales bacterium]